MTIQVTFFGSRGEIEFQKLIMNKEFEEIFSTFINDHSVPWYTIPPKAPHFGGLWEAAVNSLKRHFFRTVGKTRLQLHQFLTVLTQIEAILNSRPLVTPSNDANDALALTPGHFIIGRPLTAKPSSTPDKKTSLSLKTIDIVRQFWKRWKEEYLTSLQQKAKRTTSPSGHFAIGDIVIVIEDNIQPLMWPMDRITKVFDGNDNIIRVAQIKI